ncbi:WhiB family transcriptional regulator [Cellulosimicrobium sp. Marseille-Q4280]|uniref:WhiB family transcriptional regulator n=1 Tax=Cellulosimicrobium sp. Marseille-Q4280 TaxID=2937992 RepID=UPI00333B82B2
MSAEAVFMGLPSMFVPEGQESWQDEALCAQTDPELFFPQKGGSTAEAKKVCRQCPVVDECLEWAIDAGEEHGVWGGMSERERSAYARSRRRKAKISFGAPTDAEINRQRGQYAPAPVADTLDAPAADQDEE